MRLQDLNPGDEFVVDGETRWRTLDIEQSPTGAIWVKATLTDEYVNATFIERGGDVFPYDDVHNRLEVESV